MSDKNHHNEGQADGAKGYGNYNPPHGGGSVAASLIISTDEYTEKVEANKEYTKGYQNARDSIS